MTEQIVEMDLYDNNHPDKPSIKSYKVIDITDTMVSGNDYHIRYSDVTRGKIAQLKNGCIFVHYHINELSPEQLANDVVFKRFATDRVSASELANIIYQNQ